MNSYQYAYVGSSWAVKSFDPPNLSVGKTPTSLAEQWNIPYANLSQVMSSPLERISAVENYFSLHGKLPIIWIYNEPIADVERITGMPVLEFIQRSDWRSIWNECNQYCLDRINSLETPVLLIGGSTDVVDCNYSNITVGHVSWQKYLAVQAGITVDQNTVYVKMDDGGDYAFNHCWAAELMHKVIHENPKVTPSKEITDAIWDIFFFWEKLKTANLFYDAHPNYRATELFAKLLYPTP